MSNVNLQASASSTTYQISLEQMEALIAENLMVPVECISVRYKLESSNYDGPGFASQHVGGIEVTVNNALKEEIEQRLRRTRPLT